MCMVYLDTTYDTVSMSVAMLLQAWQLGGDRNVNNVPPAPGNEVGIVKNATMDIFFRGAPEPR